MLIFQLMSEDFDDNDSRDIAVGLVGIGELAMLWHKVPVAEYSHSLAVMLRVLSRYNYLAPGCASRKNLVYDF